MNKADKYNYMNISEILDEGFLDKNPRPHYADGSPAHTLFVNHNYRTYDLSRGEFPITSLRPIAWKTGIKEMLAIYQRQSNKIEDFEKMGCFWWKDWELEDGTIGKAYPYNLESHRPQEMKKLVLRVPRKILEPVLGEAHLIESFERKDPINDTIYFNRYQVLGSAPSKDGKNRYYEVQFINNNYKTIMRADTIGKSRGSNPYDRTVYGIGYLGEYQKYTSTFEEEEIKKIKIKWDSMMERGYSQTFKTKHPTYQNVFVHYRWHCFANFLEDIQYIPQFHLAREENFIGWDLDKDYYGSNAYSKETCVFLRHDENTLYNKAKGYYKITDEVTKETSYEINLSDFAKKINTTQAILQRAVANNGKYKSFIFEQIENDDKYVYRYELSRNQINDLLSIGNSFTTAWVISELSGAV